MEWLRPRTREECKEARLAVFPTNMDTFGFGASLYFVSLHLWLARVTGRTMVMPTFPMSGYTNGILCDASKGRSGTACYFSI